MNWHSTSFCLLLTTPSSFFWAEQHAASIQFGQPSLDLIIQSASHPLE